MPEPPCLAFTSKRLTSRSGFSHGIGRSTTALNTLNMVLLAPMPSASMSTTVTVNPGFAVSDRTASRKSRDIVPIRKIQYTSDDVTVGPAIQVIRVSTRSADAWLDGMFEL